MASRYQNFIKGIGLVPNAADANSKKGDLNVVSGDGKLYYHNGTSSSPSVTEAHAAALTNKTLNFDFATTGNVISNIPDGALTANVMLLNAIQTVSALKSFDIGTFALKGASGSTVINASAIASGIITIPAANDTLVGLNTLDVLTNKTLSGNTAANLINGLGTINFNSSGTITVPNATDTLVGKETSDTLKNKTISAADNTISGLTNANLSGTAGITNANLANSTISGISLGSNLADLTVSTGLVLDSGTAYNGGTAKTISIDSTVVTLTGGQSLSNKTLVNPVIDDTLVSIATKDLKINAATTKNVLLQNEGNTIATVASTGLTLASDKQITLTNNSQTVGIKASGSASASYTITLPAAAPTSGTAIIYDGTNYVWSSAGGWNSSIQTSLSGGGNVTISLTQGQQVVEVAGSGGAVTLSTTPFGSSAPNDKTVVRLFGTSSTNTVTIDNSDIAKGVYVNGQVVLFLGYVVDFMYIASIDRWVETGRNF